MTSIRKSVPAFKRQIETSAKPTGAERTGKVTGEEMESALKKLPASEAGLKAATDLYANGDVKMDAAAKRALKSFIKDHGGEVPTSSGPPRHGTGVRTASTVADMKAMLRNDDFRESVIATAFGHTRSHSSTFEVGGVKKDGDGFEVTVTKSNWRTREVQDEVAVHINRAGVPSLADSTSNDGPMIHPPRPSIQPLPNTFTDRAALKATIEGNARGILMGDLGVQLSRSDTVFVGDPEPNRRGNFDVTLQLGDFTTHAMGRKFEVEVDRQGNFVDGHEAGGRRGGVRMARDVDAVWDMLNAPDTDFKQQMITAAFGDARSRSSTYDIGSVERSGDGFDIVVEKRKRDTGALQDDIVVHINAAGVPSETAADRNNTMPYEPMPAPIGGPIGGVPPWRRGRS